MKKHILLFLILQSIVTISVKAQGSISGHVYELQSGEPIEGVKVHIKNRAGLEIGTMQPAYTTADGYFEFTDVRPNDYRIEVKHVFETAEGPVGMRLFTASDVLEVDTSAYVLTIALSRWTAEHFKESMNMSRLVQEHTKTEKFDGKMRTVKIDLPDSTLAKFYVSSRRANILGSRMIGPKGRDIKFMEGPEPFNAGLANQ